MTDTSKNDTYRAESPTHGGYGMSRGPIHTPPINPLPIAIGFCPLCGSNARKTCSNRGMFDCPKCYYHWFDRRVGKKLSKPDIQDFFVKDAKKDSDN